MFDWFAYQEIGTVKQLLDWGRCKWDDVSGDLEMAYYFGGVFLITVQKPIMVCSICSLKVYVSTEN